MNDINIPIEEIPFRSDLIEAWRNRDYSMLLDSDASAYLKSILTFKASRSGIQRGLQRFFGEAFVSSITPMIDGWYNSYQWLRKENWVNGTNLNGVAGEPIPFKEIFYRDAIVGYIGSENLRNLQKYSQEHENSTGKYPKAPDLFIIEPNGNFVFMEVKLPGDRFKKQQDDGLSLLKNILGQKAGIKYLLKRLN
jgi:hypothetical protein